MQTSRLGRFTFFGLFLRQEWKRGKPWKLEACAWRVRLPMYARKNMVDQDHFEDSFPSSMRSMWGVPNKGTGRGSHLSDRLEKQGLPKLRNFLEMTWVIDPL